MLELLKVQWNPSQDIWFTADTHYNHRGIVKGTSNWGDTSRCRDFETLEEHDRTLVNNINAVVKHNDILFHLGDWSFGSYKNGDNYKNVERFRKKIMCKNIHLITGNHDEEITKSLELQKLFKTVSSKLEVEVAMQYQGKAQGIKAIKQHISLCHYAFRVWNKSHYGSWHLYGHSHGSLDEMTPLIANPTWMGDQYFVKNYRTMDVGVDCHPQFRPYNLLEIYEIMEKRSTELEIDHHGKANN